MVQWRFGMLANDVFSSRCHPIFSVLEEFVTYKRIFLHFIVENQEVKAIRRFLGICCWKALPGHNRGDDHAMKQACRRRLIRGGLECFYLRKLFPGRLLDIELVAANAVEIPFSVFIAIERLRKLATENPLVAWYLFDASGSTSQKRYGWTISLNFQEVFLSVGNVR